MGSRARVSEATETPAGRIFPLFLYTEDADEQNKDEFGSPTVHIGIPQAKALSIRRETGKALMREASVCRGQP